MKWFSSSNSQSNNNNNNNMGSTASSPPADEETRPILLQQERMDNDGQVNDPRTSAPAGVATSTTNTNNIMHDEASTIATSSTRSTFGRSTMSYDSLTYSTASDDDDTTIATSTINNNNIINTSMNDMSFVTYSSNSGTSTMSDAGTVLSSEQLIQVLRRKQEQQHRSYHHHPVQQQQQRHMETYNQIMQPFHHQQQDPSFHPDSYQQQIPTSNNATNVYRPRSMIGGLLHRGYSTTTAAETSSSSSSLWNDPHQQYAQQQQQQLLLHHPRTNLRSCLGSPRVLFAIAVCLVIVGNLILGNHNVVETIGELGISGWHAQHRAHRVQAQLLDTKSMFPHLKPMQLKVPGYKKPKTTKQQQRKGDDDMEAGHHPGNSTAAPPPEGCEATVMLIRHCEKGNLKSHCSFMGYERSVYLASLFGDSPQEPWPAPSAIYALNKGRTKKLNFREVETVRAIADKFQVPIVRDYTTADTKALSKHLLNQVLEGDMCGKLVLVSWKHSDIPRLAQHLGCGPLEGCPFDYKGKDFDSTWQIRYVFTDFYNSKTGQSHKKWNIFGSVQPENFDPLAFSKSVGDYPPGGATSGSTWAQWGQDQNFVFYG